MGSYSGYRDMYYAYFLISLHHPYLISYLSIQEELNAICS